MTERRILIADDDPAMSRMLSGALTERGYAFVIAADAMQAVMFAVQKLPDTIILEEMFSRPAVGEHASQRAAK